MEDFYKQKWVQLVRPEVRMSNPPFPKREYAEPQKPEPFFRDEAPGFLGVASTGGPVIATSASVGLFDEPARPPEMENIFAPPDEPMNGDVPLQAPGEINPLFRDVKSRLPRETRAERATKKASDKRQDELNKRRFAPPPPPPVPEPREAPLRDAKRRPAKETRAERAAKSATEKRREELNRRRVLPPPAPEPSRVDEFASFTTNKRQMSRLGRDPRN